MNAQKQIEEHIASHPEPKRGEIQTLHDMIQHVNPGCKLWFLDGKNDEGKVVSNPDIGYGSRDHKYADGTIREFYQSGVSAGQNRDLHLYPPHAKTRNTWPKHTPAASGS